MPLRVCLLLVVTRSAGFGSLDVADLANHRVPLDECSRAAGEGTAVAGEREQTLRRALVRSLRFTARCHKTTFSNSCFGSSLMLCRRARVTTTAFDLLAACESSAGLGPRCSELSFAVGYCDQLSTNRPHLQS